MNAMKTTRPRGALLAAAAALLLAAGCGAESGREPPYKDYFKRGVMSLDFSPDGQTLAAAIAPYPHNEGYETMRLWDVQTGRVRANLKSGMQNAVSAAFSPDGTRVAACGEDGAVRLWNAETGELIREHPTDQGRPLKQPESLRSIFGLSKAAFSADGKTLISGGSDGSVHFWDIQTGAPARDRLRIAPKPRYLLTLSPDETLAAYRRHRIRLANADTGETEHILKGHTHPVWALAFSPDGNILASGGLDWTIRLWDARAGKQIRKLNRFRSGVYALAFSPDGKRLASAGGHILVPTKDGRGYVSLPEDDETYMVSVWDVQTGRRVQTLNGHTRTVWTLAFSPDGKTLASGGVDFAILLWDIETGALKRRIRSRL